MALRLAGQYCSHHYALQLSTGGCRDIVRARADSTCRRWRKCGACIDLGETRAAGRIFLQPTQHGRVRPPCTVERVADARIGARDWDFGSCVAARPTQNCKVSQGKVTLTRTHGCYQETFCFVGRPDTQQLSFGILLGYPQAHLQPAVNSLIRLPSPSAGGKPRREGRPN